MTIGVYIGGCQMWRTLTTDMHTHMYTVYTFHSAVETFNGMGRCRLMDSQANGCARLELPSLWWMFGCNGHVVKFNFHIAVIASCPIIGHNILEMLLKNNCMITSVCFEFWERLHTSLCHWASFQFFHERIPCVLLHNMIQLGYYISMTLVLKTKCTSIVRQLIS